MLVVSMLILVMVFTTACGGNTDNKPKVDENIVAVVNDENISIEDFNKNFKIIERDYSQSYPEDIWSKEFNGKTFLEIIQEQILDNLVTEAVIKQDAIKKEIEIDDAQVDEVYKSFEEQISKDEELKKFYEEQGIDEAFVKKQLRVNLIMQKHQTMLLEELKLNDAATLEEMLKDYVYQVEAQHILIMPEEGAADAEKADAAAKKKAEEILAKVKAGEDFGALAKENSMDPGSAANNGSLGYFGRGQMVPQFEDASFALNVGDISELVKTDYGYHIIKVTGKKTIEDAKADLSAEQFINAKIQAQDEIKQSKIMEYYDKLKEEADIKKYPENIK